MLDSVNRTSQEEGLAPAAGLIHLEAGASPLPDLFYSLGFILFRFYSFEPLP
jgi:hypothetical protein